MIPTSRACNTINNNCNTTKITHLACPGRKSSSRCSRAAAAAAADPRTAVTSLSLAIAFFAKSPYQESKISSLKNQTMLSSSSYYGTRKQQRSQRRHFSDRKAQLLLTTTHYSIISLPGDSLSRDLGSGGASSQSAIDSTAILGSRSDSKRTRSTRGSRGKNDDAQEKRPKRRRTPDEENVDSQSPKKCTHREDVNSSHSRSPLRSLRWESSPLEEEDCDEEGNCDEENVLAGEDDLSGEDDEDDISAEEDLCVDEKELENLWLQSSAQLHRDVDHPQFAIMSTPSKEELKNPFAAMIAEGKSSPSCHSMSTPSKEEEELLNPFAAMIAEGKSSPSCHNEGEALPAPQKPGILSPSDKAKRKMEMRKKIAKKVEEHDGKSLVEAIKNHPAHEINLTAAALAPAVKVLGLQQHAKRASLAVKGHEEKMAAVLQAGTDASLPQQNGPLSGAQVAQKNYDAARYGSTGAYAGFTNGELGTTTNGRGESVDAARSKAAAARMSGSELEKRNAEKALNVHSAIPQLVRNQGTEGSIPADCIKLINENDHPMNDRDLSENEFKDLVDGARGYEVKDTSSLDAIIKHFWPKKARAATNKKKRSRLRSNFLAYFTLAGAAMRFKFERFDDDGVLTREVGAKSKRRELAKYRFKIIEDDKRFEY
eukprot:scaffold1768_cov75-Skeletonema_dohrnii-CCMP3373.AAC.2